MKDSIYLDGYFSAMKLFYKLWESRFQLLLLEDSESLKARRIYDYIRLEWYKEYKKCL